MRDLTASVKTALADDVLNTAVLIELNFSTAVYIWSGYGDLVYDSKTYVGSGNVININGVGERSDASSVSTSITLSGLDSNLKYTLLTENWQNKEAVVKIALFDSDGDVIADPITVTRGRMDNASFTDSGNSCEVTFTIESQLVSLEQAGGARYSTSEQRLIDATDEGFTEAETTLLTRSAIVPESHTSQVGADNYRNTLYGEAKTAGTIVYALNSTSYYYMFVLANHACNDVLYTYIDGKKVTLDGSGDGTGDWAGKVHIEYGKTGSATCSNLVTASGGEWSSNHKLTGCTWAYVKIVAPATDFPDGVSDIFFVVEGKSINDLRTSVSAYSANAALVVLDYLKDANGLNCDDSQIDLVAFEDAADICDEAVSLYAGGTIPRYEINGEITTNQTPSEIIEDFTAACAGKLCYGGGKYYLLPASVITADVAFDDDDFVDAVTVTSKIGGADSYNAIRGTYINATGDYTDTDYDVIIGATGISEDGAKYWYDLVQPYVTNSSVARRLAKIYLERKRRRTSCNITVGARGLLTKVGDVVTVTSSSFGFAAKEFEVKSLDINFGDNANPAITCSLELGQTDENVYLWYANTDDNPTANDYETTPTTVTSNVTKTSGGSDPVDIDPVTASESFTRYDNAYANTVALPDTTGYKYIISDALTIYGKNYEGLPEGAATYTQEQATLESLYFTGTNGIITWEGQYNDEGIWTDMGIGPVIFYGNVNTGGVYAIHYPAYLGVEYSTDGGSTWSAIASKFIYTPLQAQWDSGTTYTGVGFSDTLDSVHTFTFPSSAMQSFTSLSLTGTLKFRVYAVAHGAVAFQVIEDEYRIKEGSSLLHGISGTLTATIQPVNE